jgi:hypothetical protein
VLEKPGESDREKRESDEQGFLMFAASMGDEKG